VVQLPRWLWLPILHGFILRNRPKKSASKYAAIWTQDGSPLAVHTRRQAELLREFLSHKDVAVDYAMRYGEPSIAQGLRKLAACRKICVLPLYPQFSRSTTESVRDLVGPAIHMVEDFHDHPAYIAALAAGVQHHWAAHGKGEKLVMSFHGLPKRAVDRGDPYQASARSRRKSSPDRCASRPPITSSPSSRASARQNGCSPTRSRPSSNWRGRASAVWT